MKNIRSEIRYLKGVGPKKAEVLARVGIFTIEDLLLYLPRRYEDRSIITPIRQLEIGKAQSIRGIISNLSLFTTKIKRKSVFQMRVQDRSGSILAVWYNMPFLKKNFTEGQEVVFYGRIELHDKLQIVHPEYEIVSGQKDSLNTGRIVPIYPLTSELTQKYLRNAINKGLAEYLFSIKEILPEQIIEKRELLHSQTAIKNIHFTTSFDMLAKAYRRIVYEEFFLLQIALAKKKEGKKNLEKALFHKEDKNFFDKFKRLLPFELTQEQIHAIDDISKDMINTKSMNRLLQGDVGSGKTVVALYAVVLSILNGYQAVFMAPTEILARQHFMTICEFLMPMGMTVRLLVSDIKQSEKKQIKQEIKDGQIDLIVGTHAMLQEDVEFKNMGVVIVDEQHKFGVAQRKTLLEKGDNPDVLYMTATPIPRTLALTVYGDLDISFIKSKPSGRIPVKTYWITEKKRNKSYEFIRTEVDKGRQAYIVYPMIEGNNDQQIKGAVSMYKEISEKVFPELKIGLLHGKMSSEEKIRIMKDLKNKKYNVLVSTVVIEVGIDVPNASVMLIEHAERFGLSQLHQLRGRIGRGKTESYCVLVSDTVTEQGMRRLNKMVETDDGFVIAEDDMQMRGPGEFFGTRQHGLPELRFGNILKDIEIMQEAREDAFKIIEQDPDLELIENIPLKRVLRDRFGRFVES